MTVEVRYKIGAKTVQASLGSLGLCLNSLNGEDSLKLFKDVLHLYLSAVSQPKFKIKKKKRLLMSN